MNTFPKARSLAVHATLTALCTLSAPVFASEYGCQVLLCLANPASNGGPRGVAECRPIINKLEDDLTHGRPFPTCDLADGNDGSTYARRVFDYYDPCPSGTKPAPAGSMLGQGVTAAAMPANAGQSLENGRGSRACVAQFVGSYAPYGWYNRHGETPYTVAVYRRVVWQQPQSPIAFDVYINNQFNQRVRW